MALFRRKSAESLPESNGYEFHPLTIRQVLVFSSWHEGPAFVHLEKQGVNFVKGTLDGKEWLTRKVDSREEGDSLISSIRDDWEISLEEGLLPEGSSVEVWGVREFGFANVDFTHIPEDFSGDYAFSLGREIAEKIRNGWYPKSETEQELLFNYFYSVPMRVGFFGPFKYILKNLTDRFPKFCGEQSAFFVRGNAAVLGFAFGRVDAFASRGNRNPSMRLGWEVDIVQTLPELNGFKFPRLKTLQFLMRKGLRFLDYLEREQKSEVVTEFKAHALWSADLWHEHPGRPEEDYLSYQQLVCRIVYGESRLAIRDRESRKVLLASRKERHNLNLEENVINTYSDDEVAVYGHCLKGLQGNNSAVAHFFLSMSQAFPKIEFEWNEKTFNLLFTSESEVVRGVIWTAIEANPSLLRGVDAQSLLAFLDSTDNKRVDSFLTDFKAARWAYIELINLWVASRLNLKLSEQDLLIATIFLQEAWNSISNDMWSNKPPGRDTLFLQVAEQTKLQPFEPWAECINFSIWNEDYFLGLFGLGDDERFLKGILDVLDLQDNEILDFFANVVANFLRYSSDERVINVLSAFENSHKPGSSDLLWKVVGLQLIDQAKINTFLNYLNSKDPSGNAFLMGIAYAIKNKNREAVLQILVILSSESHEIFWRRNKGEAEEILMKWKEFPLFFWENAEKIPVRTSERIRKFEGLSNRILKLISPAAIARMNEQQITQFLEMVKENPEILTNVSLLRAMLIAPSAPVNELAAKYVRDENKYSDHWLLMLESNLPVSQQSAFQYLQTQVESKDFPSKLLMALDSNNIAARKIALSLLSSIKTPTTLRKVVDGLVENRNTDTWSVVSKNLELISDNDKYREFTSQVFLSRRKGRKVKEEIKSDIEELIEDISEAIEKDTLIRMAHSSVARDRDWALKQIAISGIELEGVTVETAWKGNLNV